jgi:NADH-quinone oxidoreductase subunit M
VNSFPFLPVLTVAPLVGALIVGFLPAGRDRLAKVVTLAWTLALLALTVVMCAAFTAGGDRFQFVDSYPWIPQFGVRFAFGADGIALVMIALTAVLMPVVVLASWHEAETGRRSVRTYFALLLALQSTMIGVFAATDVFFFYVFFEAMLVPMYFLIGSYGGPQRQYAAVKFFVYSLVGGLLMLSAVIGLYVTTAQLRGGTGTFDWQTISDLTINRDVQLWLWLGFFVAFAIKAPLFPFHTWLPDAGGQAPIGAAVLLVGVLDKVGTFGFLRYCLPLFPDASRSFAPLVLALSLVGILYGALLAMGQSDLKRLVAYTSIAHFGFIALGVFAFTTQAGTGAVLYMVNHGLSTGALFLAVGFLIRRRRSALVADYGGAAKLFPLIAGAFFIAGLSSLALPGTSSFVSEFLVLLGTFSVNTTVAVIATTGMILAALYILLVYQRTMQGRLNPTIKPMPDMTAREAWVIAPMIVLILALGIYPKPVIDVINPAVRATLSDVGAQDPAPTAGSVPGQGR